MAYKCKSTDNASPKNKGQPWTQYEVNALLDNVKQKLSMTEIAAKHERTIGGIKSRLRDIAYEMYINGSNIQSILDKTGITEEQLNDKISIMKTVKNPRIPRIVTNSASSNINNNLQNINNINADIAEIKSDIKKIFDILKNLELA